ncbi:MAG: CHAD domain-containing protein, partial [Pseudomonadota bacterium]
MEEIVISSQATDAGESEAEAGVERARVSDPSPVTRACSAFEAFRRGGSNYFGRVAQTLPAAFAPPDADAADAAARASEAARRARVALRRARVLLALYRGAAAPGAFEEIDAGAKAVSRALGAARDA